MTLDVELSGNREARLLSVVIAVRPDPTLLLPTRPVVGGGSGGAAAAAVEYSQSM